MTEIEQFGQLCTQVIYTYINIFVASKTKSKKENKQRRL